MQVNSTSKATVKDLERQKTFIIELFQKNYPVKVMIELLEDVHKLLAT